MGASIAYFLARRGIASIVVERTGLACAASGKGGGFLAANWCDGTPVEPLARRSFALHAELAGDLQGDWGYRRLDAYGGSIASGRRAPPAGGRLSWLSNDVALDGQLGSAADTAQVHPGRLAAALMRAAEPAGAALHLGEVTGILRNRTGETVTGVEVDGEALEGDAVVIAMGPWSQLARRWLPLPAVHALKGHSLVFDTGAELPPEALFLEHRGLDGEVSSPEIFPRMDGTTYIAAINSETPLPIDPAAVAADPGTLERLHAIAAAVSPVLARSKSAGAAGLLSSHYSRRPAPDRPCPGSERRLRRHGPQRLGHPERARDGRSDSRADPRRASRYRAALCVRSRAFRRLIQGGVTLLQLGARAPRRDGSREPDGRGSSAVHHTSRIVDASHPYLDERNLA